MSQPRAVDAPSPFRQPKAVWAVAFASVVSFMGIGLVDPILPALSQQLHATPAQVSLLFTSYLVITALAMLVTGWVSSRLGAKRTLIAGLVLIVIFSAMAGQSDSIGAIVGWRAGWGLGNALFIATSLAVIVSSASGGFAGAIILYETALGLGIAVGPLLGGELGSISWRGPFFGVAVLMSIALIATVVLVPNTPRPPKPASLTAPLKALRHRGLLVMSLTALLYNWGFFTLLGFAPFPMHLDAHHLGLVFTAWGILVATFSVFVAPRLQARFGTARTLYANLAALSLVMLVIAVGATSPTTIVTSVIVAGAFIGINNTLTTHAVMSVAPVERPVASASYGFVRFIGGGLAPFAAGKLAEHYGVHTPFYLGALAFALAIPVLATGHRLLATAEAPHYAEVTGPQPAEPAEPTPVGSAGRPVVVAVDGSPTAKRVVMAAGRLAARIDAPVEVLHVHEVDVLEEMVAEAEDPTVAQARTIAHVAVLRDHGVRATGHVVQAVGDHAGVGRLVGRYANERRARLLVVGAPTHEGYASFVEGSASEQIVREARCHVLWVRPDAPEPEGEPSERPGERVRA